MEVQVIMSILTYLILFNSCLTFRLTVFNNLIITTILYVSMIFIREQIESLFVVPMFLVLTMYICWLKKEDRMINVFLIMFSYLSLVIVDNLTHLIWLIIGLDIKVHWPIYMIIDYPIFFFLFRFIRGKVMEIKKLNFFALSPKILTTIGLDLILCMLIFVVHILLNEQIGYSSLFLFGSIVLYVVYFILTYFMILMIVKAYEENAKIMTKQISYDNLREYMKQIEDVYQELHSFKHDYVNIMISMSGYIETGNVDGLREYYVKEIFPISYKLKKDRDSIETLYNLEIIELKSLIAVKLNYAQELNIPVNVEILEKIDKVKMNIIDLARIIGILLDNAIEACQNCKDSGISIGMVKTNSDITIIVKNTYVRQDIDYSKLGNIGVSSKGEHRGTGLYNIKSIVNEYNNVIMDTEHKKGYFTQVIEIYDNM